MQIQGDGYDDDDDDEILPLLDGVLYNILGRHTLTF